MYRIFFFFFRPSSCLLGTNFQVFAFCFSLNFFFFLYAYGLLSIFSNVILLGFHTHVTHTYFTKYLGLVYYFCTFYDIFLLVFAFSGLFSNNGTGFFLFLSVSDTRLLDSATALLVCILLVYFYFYFYFFFLHLTSIVRTKKIGTA